MISEKQTLGSALPQSLVSIVRNKIVLSVCFVIATAVAAHITIPLSPVPFTLQTTAVILSGIFLGRKYGFLTQASYLALGAMGLPVFAPVVDGTFGLMSLFGMTGGYLLAFPLAAYLSGSITENNRSLTGTFLAFVAGELIIISVGMFFLFAFYIHDIRTAVMLGAYPFAFWTLVKIVFGSGLAVAFLSRSVKK